MTHLLHNDELKNRVLLKNESVDVYLADIRRLVALMGHGQYGEPLIRCALVSGLPSDVAMQLKSTVNAERLELSELVGRLEQCLLQGEVILHSLVLVLSQAIKQFSVLYVQVTDMLPVNVLIKGKRDL